MGVDIRPNLPKDAEADRASNVKIGMNSVARVLDEFHFWGLQGILVWNVEVQLHESISVDGIGGNNIGVKLEEAVVLEDDKVVRVLVLTACLLKLLALLGHAFGGQWCRHGRRLPGCMVVS